MDLRRSTPLYVWREGLRGVALCGEGRFVHHLGYRRIRVDVGVDLRACEFLFERDAHLGDELGGIFADDVCAHCAKSNGSGMQTISGIMSQKSKTEYLESCGMRYPNRNRAGRSAMIDEVSDVLGWDRKHAIKALNGKVSLGKKARRRGSKAIHSEAEKAVIVGIWKSSEQPCGTRLKQTLPPWLPTSLHPSENPQLQPAHLGSHHRPSPKRGWRSTWTQNRACQQPDQ